MRKYADQQIIEEAIARIGDGVPNDQEGIDVAVDFRDEHQIVHSYVVSFKKDEKFKWSPTEISEISTW